MGVGVKATRQVLHASIPSLHVYLHSISYIILYYIILHYIYYVLYVSLSGMALTYRFRPLPPPT